MIHFRKPTRTDIDIVCFNMRPIDAVEVFNSFYDDNPFHLGQVIQKSMDAGNFCSCCYWQGRPEALLGYSEIHPGTMAAWMFATKHWTDISTSMTKFAIRALKPELIAAKVHRLQAITRYDHAEAHRWLEFLGFGYEGRLKAYGRDGSDYLMYAATHQGGREQDVLHEGENAKANQAAAASASLSA
jgi:hypothetical protein